MVPYVKLEEVIKEEGKKLGYLLLGEEQGCVNGCFFGFMRRFKGDKGEKDAKSNNIMLH